MSQTNAMPLHVMPGKHVTGTTLRQLFLSLKRWISYSMEAFQWAKSEQRRDRRSTVPSSVSEIRLLRVRATSPEVHALSPLTMKEEVS